MSKIIKGKNPNSLFTVRYRNPGQHEKSFKTSAEAQAFAKTADATGDPGSETFASYAARWVDQTARNKVSRTSSNYRILLRLHINPAFGDVPLKSITREMCKKLLLDSGLTPSKARSAGMLISAVLNEAVRDKRIPENPSKGIKVKYDSGRADIVPVTYAQLCTIESELHPNERLALWLMYGLGLRIGESLGVHTDSVRDDGETLRVEEQAMSRRAGAEPVTGPLKHRQTGQFRDIPLPSWLLDRINAHIAEFGTNGYLFPYFALDGRNHENWRYRFNKGRAKAGVSPKLIPHMLRHIYASNSLADNVPIGVLKEYLGHKDVNLTVNLYGHLLPRSAVHAREAADKSFAAFKAA